MSQNLLIKKFKEISETRWIKGGNNTTNSVGLTFESLLNKNPDSMYFPDYYGIEIYKLKSFKIFLELLKERKIKIMLVGRVSRSGTEESRQRNKNLVFSIDKDKLDLLFEKKFEYNHDTLTEYFYNDIPRWHILNTFDIINKKKIIKIKRKIWEKKKLLLNTMYYVIH